MEPYLTNADLIYTKEPYLTVWFKAKILYPIFGVTNLADDVSVLTNCDESKRLKQLNID